MAFDYSKLRGRIVEKYGTQNNFAKGLKRSDRLISLKMNNKVGISQDEVILWSEKLDIPESEITAYFFKEKV